MRPLNNRHSRFVVVVHSDDIIELNDLAIEFLRHHAAVEIDDPAIDSFPHVNIGDGDINMAIENAIALFSRPVFGNFNYIERC